jgi:dTDP-glucose 4,6-dehydratase
VGRSTSTSTSILVTGGAGFIGSNFIHYLAGKHPDWSIVNLDKLTYAGNLENLTGISERPNYRFVRGDIADRDAVAPLVEECDYVVNFAAETHVDRSIHGAGEFILTDVYGTFVLLEAFRSAKRPKRFIQISTDEVYGAIETGSARETDALVPRNPYSASKAGADRLAYSYFVTYEVPVVVTRASNNYGPRQYPEKVIPLFVTNALEDKPLPLYGDGLQVRDWLHVEDHCRALDLLLEKGVEGETYNIGGGHELTNLELTRRVLALLGKPESLIAHVKDRPGHDRRYSLDTTKLRGLGWTPRVRFDEGLASTVDWYRSNPGWWQRIKHHSGEFRSFHDQHYAQR